MKPPVIPFFPLPFLETLNEEKLGEKIRFFYRHRILY